MQDLLAEKQFKPVKVLCLYRYWLSTRRSPSKHYGSVMIEVYSSKQILEAFEEKMKHLIRNWDVYTWGQKPGFYVLEKWRPENGLELF